MTGIMPFFAGIMPLYYAFIMLHESREWRKLDNDDNVKLCTQFSFFCTRNIMTHE
jgi:hypothetical protein